MLFARDKMYGGLRMDEFAPLADLRGEGKYLAESSEFILWECEGVIAENIRTSVGDDAAKVGFVVSHFDTPGDRQRVATMASAIVDQVKYALDLAREQVANEEGEDAAKAADFAKLAPIAFQDLPAVGKLQRITTDLQPATILTFVCPLNEHNQYAYVQQAVARADRENRKRERELKAREDEPAPF